MDLGVCREEQSLEGNSVSSIEGLRGWDQELGEEAEGDDSRILREEAYTPLNGRLE